MSEQRRSQTRHDVSLSAVVKIDGADTADVATTIANLSLGGCFVSYEQRLPINQRMVLEFRVPTHEQPIAVGGTVRWSSEMGSGVQFDGLRAAEVWSLNKYFEQLLVDE